MFNVEFVESSEVLSHFVRSNHSLVIYSKIYDTGITELS